MSGTIHALVIHHGPRNAAAFAVASIIAEDMFHAGDTALLSTEELAKRTRLSRATVTRAVKLLREEGWLRYFAGGGKGVASRYQLRLAEALSTCSDTCSHRAGLVEDALAIPAHREHESARYLLTEAPNLLTVSTSTIPVGDPIQEPAPEPAPDEHLPVVVGVRTGPDDDAVRVALEPLRIVQPKRHLRLLVGSLIERGWTATQLARHLNDNVDLAKTNSPTAMATHVLGRLTDPPVSSKASAATPPCSTCGQTQTECRKKAAATGDDHAYAPLRPRLKAAQ